MVSTRKVRSVVPSVSTSRFKRKRGWVLTSVVQPRDESAWRRQTVIVLFQHHFLSPTSLLLLASNFSFCITLWTTRPSLDTNSTHTFTSSSGYHASHQMFDPFSHSWDIADQPFHRCRCRRWCRWQGTPPFSSRCYSPRFLFYAS